MKGKLGNSYSCVYIMGPHAALCSVEVKVDD